MSTKSNPIGSFVNAENLTYTSASIKSRLEIARDDILLAFAGINRINGYRTDVNQCIPAIRWIDQIPVFPEIGVVITQQRFGPTDTACTVFDCEAKVVVQGAVQASTPSGEYSKELQAATEAMAHDMGKVIVSIFKSNIVTNDHKWNVLYKEGWKIDSFIDLGNKGGLGVVMASFSIHLRNMGAKLD